MLVCSSQQPEPYCELGVFCVKKNIVTIITILATVYFIIKTLLRANFSDRQTLIAYLIIILPIICRNLLNGYFLIHSLFQKAKDIDDGNLITIISFVGTDLSLFMGLFVNILAKNPNSNLLIWGTIMSLSIYPFYIRGLITLGYNLTILPEANSLNTKGIYSLSRHPLYLSYIIWFVLQILVFQTLIMVFVSIIQIAALIIRARYEEKILEKNFPEYQEYKETVGWLGHKARKVE
jgi:protein-S-isoprenylcysteine O-methyltransferase Ste14